MANSQTTQLSKSSATPQYLSVEEQAVINSAGNTVVRRLVTAAWRFKLRLQFTGWLQYLLPAIVTLAVFLLALLVRLLGAAGLATGIAWVGMASLALTAFDLVTVKFHIHPRERRPKRNDDLDAFDLMRARHSCRAFQPRKLAPEDREELLASVRRHSAEPTLGRAPVRFEYIAAPLTVWPTVNAGEFLVAIAPLEYDRTAVIDVGRSLQKIVMDATRMGLGTCWIGPGADHESIIRDLGERFDPEQDHIICVCAVGYQSWYTPTFIRIFNARFSQRRMPLSKLFFADPDFEQPLDTEAPPFDLFGRNYEVCQWAPSSYNGQTTRCVAAMDRDRLSRFDFYADTESRYYAPVALGIWLANWELGCAALGIHGRLAQLSAKQRGLEGKQGLPALPHYEMSWVLDRSL